MKVAISANNKNYIYQILEKFTIHFSSKHCRKVTLNDEKTTVTIDTANSYYTNKTMELLSKFIARNFNNEVTIAIVER